jgi:hypothetical protein
VQLGRLLRTAFLTDYFTNPLFRHELRRVLNRGEAVNAMKRSIHLGRIVAAQAKQDEEMQAVADALNLLANIVMALEHNAVASRARALCQSASVHRAGAHRQDRADALGGDQSARHLPIRDGAIR